MVFTGQQAAREIPAFVQACDVLVSPRRRGTNTPLKIYSYLRSGKPIVATNLLTHTQVLSPTVARLVPVEAKALAEALIDLVNRPEERQRLATAAAALAEEKYSREAYVRRTELAYARLFEARRGPADSKRRAASGMVQQ
jgi:glycosyltransferase involved in cell wall biosynthesis